MHISLSDFWDMTPREFNSLFKGYKLDMKRKDEEAWMQGLYNYKAFETVMSHVMASLAGKKSDATYLDKPFMQKVQEIRKLSSKEQTDKEFMSAQVWVHQLKKSGLPPSPYN